MKNQTNSANSSYVTIIGAGLAGSEAAWQLVSRGIPVKLFEMRPNCSTQAHKTSLCAELVCSNSLRGAAMTNAVGLLKEELKLFNSLIMDSAQKTQVPAGGALAVDRLQFSSLIDSTLRKHPLLQIITEEVKSIPHSSIENPVIIASGPLTSEALALAIKDLTGSEHLAFYDAISPVVLHSSLDLNKVFAQSRYDKGDGKDYLNIPLSQDEYYEFVQDILQGEKFSPHTEAESSGQNLKPFEGCMPIEDMCERGPETMRFGPLKPMGLTDPNTGRRPYAVVQLRRDDTAGELWNFVGMQTRLKHGEQIRIFRKLPGLKNAEFVRLGSVHRNSFINSPKCLKSTLEYKNTLGQSPLGQSILGLFFAGQITGVEGYVESTACGLVAGINAARLIQGLPTLTFSNETAIGALTAYISDETRTEFQPMNISFGLIPKYISMANDPMLKHKMKKDDKRLLVARESLDTLIKFQVTHNLYHNAECDKLTGS